MANSRGIGAHFNRQGKGIYVGDAGIHYTSNASAPDDAEFGNGRVWYDSNGLRLRHGGATYTIATSSTAGTLDDVYNNGSSATVDTGTFELAGNLAATDVLTVSNSDAAGTKALIELSHARAASKDIDGTGSLWSVTAGGAMTVASLTSSGNVDLGASGVLYARSIKSDDAAAIALAIDASTTGTIGIGQTSTGAITLYRATTVSGALTVSTGGVTIDAGGLTVTGDVTQTAGNISATVTATTGNGMLIDGSTITTGNVLRLEYDAANSGAGFGALSVTEDGSEVFVIGEDGATVIAGSAAGTAALTLTAGDLGLSSGRMSIAGDASNANLFTVTRSNTATGGNGVTVAMGSAAQAGHGVAVSWAGAGTGDAISVDMTNNVAGAAFKVTGAGTRTDNLIEIDDSSGAAGAETVQIQKSAGAATMVVLDANGAAGADTFEIDHDGQVSGRGVYVHGAEWTGTASEGLMDLETTGTSVPAGQMARIVQGATGQHAAAIDGSALFVSDAATAPGAGTSYAVTIDATNIEALHVTTGKSLFDEQAEFGGGALHSTGDVVLNDAIAIGFGTASADGNLESDGTNIDWTITAALTLGDGGTTNYANFSAAGLLTFVGTAQRTKTFFVPFSDFELHSGTPAVTQVGAGIVRGWALDKDADEAVIATYQVPDNAVSGAYNGYIHYAANAVAGDVVLDLQTLACVEGEDLTAAGTTNSVTDTVAGTANLKNVTAAMATAALVAGDSLHILVNRDANNVADDLAVDAIILGVEFRYTADRI